MNQPLYPYKDKINPRQLWANNRFWMESENIKSKRYGGKSHHYWYALLGMLKVFEWGLKVTGMYQQGLRNAYDLAFREVPVIIPNLPPAFHGFTILHITDLHLDGMPELEDIILKLIEGRTFDICVLTGDYRTQLHGPVTKVMDSLRVLVASIQSRNGILGVLGNHDDVHMVSPMEAMGINMLINENHIIDINGDRLQFIGTDDVHYYYTDQAIHALEKAHFQSTIALVHSPELFEVAAEVGVDLYLCGHTHGGQICLPGGIPLIKFLNHGKSFYKGLWKYNQMQGITNLGAGTSGIPIRFNTRGEVLSIKLLCNEKI